MGYVLGIDVGTRWATAAVCRLDGGGWGPPGVARLGVGSPRVASLLHVASDGSILHHSERHSVPPEQRRPVRGFVDRIGDDVPLIIDGRPCAPEVLTAALVRWMAARVAVAEGAPADHTVVSHPGSWAAHRRRLLRDALYRNGMGAVTLLPEPITAAEGAAAHTPVDSGGHWTIFALGGSSARAALVRRGRSGAFELLDQAEISGSGADDFDDLLFAHVRTEVGGPGRWDDLSAGAAVADLREACTSAKERLSTADEAPVAVDLPWSRTQVTVARADFEEMIRPVVETFASLAVRASASAVRAASRRPDGLVLLGGATRIPLVASMVAEALDCPPATQPEPEHTAALGAALAAVRLVSRAPSAPPILAGLDLPAPSRPPAAERIGPGQPPRPPIDISPLELPARLRRIPLQRRTSDATRRHSRSAR